MFLFDIMSGGSAVTPGSNTFNANGTFTVPEYNSLTVVVEGRKGADGQPTPNPDTVYNDYNFAAGGTGANGGYSTITYLSGSGPTPGAVITCRILNADLGRNFFSYGTTPSANNGGNGSNATYQQTQGSTGGPQSEYFDWVSGTDGSPGLAAGGTTNTTGGSTTTNARITISWS